MKKTIGFIGSGNMGQAMIGGIIKAGLVESSNIIISDISQDKLDIMAKTYSVRTTTDACEVARQADIIVLAVKPDIYNQVMLQIKSFVNSEKVIVTIAAGKTIADIEAVLGQDVKVVRTMPNTPALVNEGMAALCHNKHVTAEELAEVKSIYESFGKAEAVSEQLIDSVIGISGSAPAYVFMFIEALADAGVLGGMPRDKAYRFAAQAVLGSAKMVLETGKHPGELKDAVCSPAGTTIEAVAALETEGFRAAVIKAAVKAMDKAKTMSGK